MANPTAETIIGLARNLIREDAGSDVPVISDAFMLTSLSEANQKWADAFNTSGNEPQVFQRETGFDLVPETAIDDTNGTTTASVAITVDSNSFPDSAGIAVVWDDNIPDVFSYTAKTATTFTGVDGLAFAHEDNDAIQALYKLPSTFGSFRQSPQYGDGVYLNGPLSYIGGPPPPGFFSMYDDGTSKYLWLPRQASGSASVWFDKASATIDSTDDTVDVPEKYQYFLVWHLVAMAYVGREDDFNKMIIAQRQSDAVLQRALQNRNVNKKIRPRSFGRVSRDYTVIDGQFISL